MSRVMTLGLAFHTRTNNGKIIGQNTISACAKGQFIALGHWGSYSENQEIDVIKNGNSRIYSFHIPYMMIEKH